MLVPTNHIWWKRESEIWILWGPWKWFMSQSILSPNPEPGANCNSLLEMTSHWHSQTPKQPAAYWTRPVTAIPATRDHRHKRVSVCDGESFYYWPGVSAAVFIDSTTGRYVYQKPPEQKLIKCCEADWNVSEASGPRAEESAQKHRGLLGRPRADWDPKLSW